MSNSYQGVFLSSEAIQCEFFTFLGESCLDVESLNLPNMYIFKAVSPNGCKHLCKIVYKDSCSLVFFDIIMQVCYMTQPLAIPLVRNKIPCQFVEVYRRHRCTGREYFCLKKDKYRENKTE